MDDSRRLAPVYIAPFDGIRAFAILAIAVLHTTFLARWIPGDPVPHDLTVSLYLSLDVLFFVSGFVIFLPAVLTGGLGDLRAFFIRRFARIAPAFYVSLVVLALLSPLLEPDVHPPFPPVDAGTILSHVLFVHMEAAIAYGSFVPGFGLNGPVWTLALDMVFYALLPIVAGWYLRRPLLGFALAAALTAGWRAGLDPGDAFFRHTLDPSRGYLVWHQAPLFLADWAAGMTAAWAYVRLLPRAAEPRVRSGAAVACCLSAAALVGLWLLVGSSLTDSRDPVVVAGVRFLEEPWQRVLIAAVFAVFAVSVSLAPRWVQWPLANPVSRWLGEISYSIYLYHVIVLHLLVFGLGFGRGSRDDFLVLAAVALPLTVLVGWASYVLVERPGRLMGRRLAARYGGARPGAGAPAPRAVMR